MNSRMGSYFFRAQLQPRSNLVEVRQLSLEAIAPRVSPHVPEDGEKSRPHRQKAEPVLHLRLDEFIHFGIDGEVLQDRLPVPLPVADVVDEKVHALHARNDALSQHRIHCTYRLSNAHHFAVEEGLGELRRSNSYRPPYLPYDFAVVLFHELVQLTPVSPLQVSGP